MILIKNSATLQKHLASGRQNGRSIGFVPTMGALHEGHLSLIRQAVAASDIVVCSIFVNPTQFNDPVDFQKYPSTIENDIQLLEASGTTILFLPSVKELYPHGLTELEIYNLGQLEKVFEGEFRPGHFQGVCQVMRRLLDHIQPDRLFMGQKDFQQCMVVNKLLQLIGSSTTLEVCATVREPGGLAMSSRNMRLDEQQRKHASLLYQQLANIRDSVFTTSLKKAVNDAKMQLEMHGFKVEYVAVTEAASLEPLQEWSKQQMVVLAAVVIGNVRLIDNLLIGS